MLGNEKLVTKVKEKLFEDEEILKEVRADLDLLTEVRYRILRKKLHKQLNDLVENAMINEKVQINSVNDLITVINLDLLLSDSNT